jgi:ATP-dependent Lon protease
MITDVDELDESSDVPVLPLRDVVVYPHMVIPLFVGRDKSIVALDRAMAASKRILLVAQKKRITTIRNPATCMKLERLRQFCSY